MRIKNLYIIGFCNGPDEEIEGVCTGLFSKHVNRVEAMAYVDAVVQNGATSSLTLKMKLGSPSLGDEVSGVLGVEAVEPMQEEKILKSRRQSLADSPIGIYIVSHGNNNMSGIGSEAKPAANLVRQVVPKDCWGSIEKIVVLACAIAYAEPRPLGGEVRVDDNDDDLEQMSYMEAFVKLLGNRGIRPIVAGYDCFITAFPHQPTDKKDNTVYKAESARGETAYKKLEAAEKVDGRKVAQWKGAETASKRNIYATVDKDYRSTHKRYYRVDQGKVRVSTHGDAPGVDWSTLWTDQ